MEKQIIDFIKKRYSPKAIVIVGSRAVGDYNKNSDWDIYIFTSRKIKESVTEFHKAVPAALKDEDIDLYIYSLKGPYPDKLYRDFRYSRIVLDNGLAASLKKKALSIKPREWSADYALGRYHKARRYMRKLENLLSAKNYPELCLRLSWHYGENLIEWWFAKRGEHSLRPQQAFDYIRRKDPAYYRQLSVLFSEKSTYSAKVDAVRKMHGVLFGE